VQKRRNLSRCRLGRGLRWAEGSIGLILFARRRQCAQFQSYSLGGINATRRHSPVSCAKAAEPIDLPFGLWTRDGRRKHKFSRIRQVAPMSPDGRAHWRQLENMIEPSVCGGDAVLCQITLHDHLFMVALCNRADHYIFILFLSFFPRLISAVGDWMFTILWHMVWP